MQSIRPDIFQLTVLAGLETRQSSKRDIILY